MNKAFWRRLHFTELT